MLFKAFRMQIATLEFAKTKLDIQWNLNILELGNYIYILENVKYTLLARLLLFY